jgi:hypothetical protein
MKAGALVHPGSFMLPGLLRTSENTDLRKLNFGEDTSLLKKSL